MKSLRFFPFLAALALCLAGCIPSVNPFYTEADLRAEPSLAGRWRITNNDAWEDWVLTPDDAKGYALTVTTHDGKKGEFAARLFELNGQPFLDFIATEVKSAPDQYEMVQLSLFPGHMLGRVEWVEDGFRLALFDFEWLSKHLERNPSALAHHRGEHGKVVLLTADTPALQRFVLAHLGEGELFNKFEAVWRRQAGTDAPAPAGAAP